MVKFPELSFLNYRCFEKLLARGQASHISIELDQPDTRMLSKTLGTVCVCVCVCVCERERERGREIERESERE